MFDVQFLSAWTLVTPQPYRYLDKQYVEAFFADGTLRLSSVARFAKHEDEQRQDENEGKSPFVARSQTGQIMTIASLVQMGFNAYVLCASSYYSERIMRLFGCDSYFRINSTVDFANAVSRHVPGFSHGTEGLCVYEENRGILRESETGWTMETDEHDGQLTYDPADLQRMKDYIGQSSGLLPLFLKSADYAEQAEYRLLWFTHGVAAPFLDIKVPEARQFCTPPPGVSSAPLEAPEQVRNEREIAELESMVEAGILRKVVPRTPEAPAEKDAT